jgi:hypothetical protein
MTRITRLPGALVALLFLVAGGAGAYETYNGGCHNCHGAFDGDRAVRGQVIRFGDKHRMHNGTGGGMAADCALCHIGRNKDPMIGKSDGTSSSPGIGCTGCHKAEGLRAHHAVSGIGICSACHSDDGTPDPENLMPLYYGTPDTLVDGACNAEAVEGVNENWTVGDFVGLDNDGDGLYDKDDPDCANDGPDPVAPEADAGGNTFAIDLDDSGSETVALDGSGSSDADDDIESYEWRENGEIIARGVNPNVTLDTGLHTIELTVTDAAGLSDTDTVKVRVFAKPVNLAVALRDANGNSSEDFVQALLAGGVGKYKAFIRDGADGSAIHAIGLGTAQLRLMTTLQDVSGNSRPELTVLTRGDNGAVLVRLFDTGSRKLVGKFNYRKDLEPIALLALNDRQKGLGSRAVAVVQTGSDGTVQAQVRRAPSGENVGTVAFGKAYVPVGAATVRDIDGEGVDEIVVFGVNADGKVRAQLRDALTGKQVAAHFFDPGFPPVLVAAIPSMNNNVTDELVVLGVDDSGQIRAEVRDSKTGKQLATVPYDKKFPPLSMSYVAHPDGAALAVLGEDSAGKRQARTKLLATNFTVGVVPYPPSLGADNLLSLDDADGDGGPELLLSGELASGRIRIITKDAVTGAELYRRTLP